MAASCAELWYADWPKLSGWAAFAVTLLTGGVRWWLVRRRVALGPAVDEVRDQLMMVRDFFEEITNRGGFRQDWFKDDDRRKIARNLREHTERRSDRALKNAMNNVADTWDSVAASAPRPRIRGGYLEDYPTATDKARTAEEQPLFDQQLEAAHSGVDQVATALTRLAKLERRTHGR